MTFKSLFKSKITKRSKDNRNSKKDFENKELTDTIIKKRKKSNIIIRTAEIAMLTFATITTGISFTQTPYFYYLEKYTSKKDI